MPRLKDHDLGGLSTPTDQLLHSWSVRFLSSHKNFTGALALSLFLRYPCPHLVWDTYPPLNLAAGVNVMIDKFAERNHEICPTNKWRGQCGIDGQLNRESSKIDLPSICNPGRFFSRKHCSTSNDSWDTSAALLKEIEQYLHIDSWVVVEDQISLVWFPS